MHKTNGEHGTLNFAGKSLLILFFFICTTCKRECQIDCRSSTRLASQFVPTITVTAT